MTLAGSADQPSGPAPVRRTLDLNGFNQLINELASRGFEVYGPQVVDGVIAHRRLDSVDQLPVGVTDNQSGGRYRLVDREGPARFGYAVGPQSWKELLHPPRTKVWTMARVDGRLEVTVEEPKPVSMAFIGVRPCELAAIWKQDRVLLDGPHPDPAYLANRSNLFTVVVNCGSPADTCFCPSLGTGPAVAPPSATNGDRDGDRIYDLAMTELVSGPAVSYVATAGTDRGAEVLEAIDTVATTEAEQIAVQDVNDTAVQAINRELETEGIRELLYQNLESDQWERLAERCLTCGNCTLACPTCFCTNLEDVTDLSGDITDRWRVWDSCFSLEFSHLGPGPVRASAASRYRQWLVHKLGGWIDQFDESGCVGCGRCITWCPVGIDLTEELRTMRARPPIDEVPA